MGRPMPAGIRATLRAVHHPARAVDCPWCHAHAHQSCTTPSKRRRKTDPCPGRVTAWAVQTAVCPACAVEPGTPCHIDGRPLDTAHPARHDEATRTTT